MEKKVFRKGDPVTAEFMTELTQTVATAESNAAEAKEAAAKAESNAALFSLDGTTLHITVK